MFAVVNEGGGFGSILRVAGESTVDYDPYDPNNAPVPNNELGYDDSGNGIYLSLIDLYHRVGVERMGLNGANFDGESFVVTFVGKPSEASVDNPAIPGNTTPLLFSDQKGIWSVRVDSRRELQPPASRVFHPTSPIPVIQLHDKIDGEEVIDFELHDPVDVAAYDPSGAARGVQAGDHYVAFWAGVLPVVGPAAAKVFRGSPGYGQRRTARPLGAAGRRHRHRPGRHDRSGLHRDGRQSDAQGCVPGDRLAGRSARVRYEPAPTVTSELVAMFAQSPLANPDGTTGVRLHIDAGPGVDATARRLQQLGRRPPRRRSDRHAQLGDGPRQRAAFWASGDGARGQRAVLRGSQIQVLRESR